MATGPSGEAEDGVEADAGQPAGGPHAVALGQVRGDGQGLALGEVGAVQRGAGPLGKVLAAGGAAEAAEAPLLAGPAVGAAIAPALVAVGGAVGVGASETAPIRLAHGPLRSGCRAPNSLGN